MAITDAKATIGLPVGARAIRKSDGTAPTVRFAPVGESLLANGGFETTTAPWAVGAGCSVAIDNTAKVGTKGMLITRSASTPDAALSEQVPVVPGVTYHASAWVRVGTSTSIQGLLAFYDAAGAFISQVGLGNAVAAATYSFISGTGTAPGHAATARVYFTLGTSTTSTAYADAVTLRPCVPLVESPFTEPTTTGAFAGGSVSYDVSAGAHFLGDAKAYDMGTQTDGTLAASSYTRVYGQRHVFTGDLLLDNGIVRAWLKAGHSSTGAIRMSCYADGVWSAFQEVRIDTGGDDGTIQGYVLQTVSRASVVVRLVDTSGNASVLTLDRGAMLMRVDTTRVVATSAYQDFEVTRRRFATANAAAPVGADSANPPNIAPNTTGSGLTQPYALTFDVSLPFVSVLAFPKKPSTLFFDNGSFAIWRDTAATTSAFARTFFVGLVPFPWLTGGVFFKEGESGTLGSGATSAADAAASGGNYASLAASLASTDYTGIAGLDLPLGDYTLLALVKDSNQVANDLTLSVFNNTDAVSVASADFTCTASYAYVALDFALSSTASGDTIRFRARKATATANTIRVDYFLIIPRGRNASTPAHVLFPKDLARNALMSMRSTESVTSI